MDLPIEALAGRGQVELFAPSKEERKVTSSGRTRERSRERRRQKPAQLALALPDLPLNNYAWTEREILTLLERYLLKRLRLLNDGRADRKRVEKVIRWVAAPIVPNALVCQRPLSFQACCYAWPVDPAAAQEKILRRFAPDRLRDIERAPRRSL
jgi:hypothetical protein